ncbi:MAG: SPOR domain-containing protein [Saprospiraceae bacterium]|nr:SPOR domain-containing protein [Saprospiraceae bacterium]
MKRSVFLIWFLAMACFAQAQSPVEKGDMQFAMRDYSGAIASYLQALGDDADNPAVSAQIAACYLQMQDNLQASQWFEKIVDRPDVQPEHVLSYAHVLKSLRLYAKAKFYYQKYGAFDAHVARHFVQSCDLAKAEMDGPAMYDVTTLDLNTPYSEFGPAIHEGDLLFSSFRTDIADKRKTEEGTHLSVGNALYVAGNLGKKNVKQFVRPVKGEQSVGHVRYALNGKWVAFSMHDLRSGQRLFDVRPGKMSISIGQVDDQGEWTSIKPFTYNSNEYATGYPTLNADGTVLYFASTRPGGYGGWDLYVSFRSQDGWTAPQNLGPAVNTPGNEIAPYYAERKLYFSSDWHPGLGGFDVFKAISSEGQWTTVKSMGYPLNSPKDDLDFFWDPESNTGYVTSNRIGGQGQYDIYRCTPLYEEITMIVKQQGDEKPIDGAVIRYVDHALPATATDRNGYAVIHQPLAGARDIVVSCEGYKDLKMSLRAEDQGPTRYEVFIDKAPAIEPVKHTDVSTLANVEEVKETPKEVTDKATAVAPAPSKPTTAESAVTVKGYAVQVAALGKPSTLSEYEMLERFGSVMQVTEGRYHKIRVGYFTSEGEARTALGKIKSAGYPDAFVIQTEQVGASSTYQAPTTTRGANGKKYMVRLATYSKPGNFDSSKVAHLGKIESYRKNQMTIMLLSGYATIAEAEDAREGAYHLGFRDAYVVVNVDGQLHKVTTAVTER